MSTKAMIIRILRQMKHDKRSLALIFVAPLLIIWLVSLAFGGDAYQPKIAVYHLPDPFLEQLEQNNLQIERVTKTEAYEMIKESRLDAIIEVEAGRIHLLLEGSNPSINQAVNMLLQRTLHGVPFEQLSPLSIDVEYLYGSADMTLIDSIGPILIAFFAFFFVFLVSGISFLRERIGGTLIRLMSTPIRKWEIVAGYIGGFGIFAVIQATIITLFTIYVLDIRMAGSIALVIFVVLLTALSALTLGTLLSAYANNEFQMIQFIPIVIVPQIFFSGLFNIETISPWIRWLEYVMPLAYAGDALQQIMIRGLGWDAITTNVIALIAFSALFIAANILALRKHRRL